MLSLAPLDMKCSVGGYQRNRLLGFPDQRLAGWREWGKSDIQRSGANSVKTPDFPALVMRRFGSKVTKKVDAQ